MTITLDKKAIAIEQTAEWLRCENNPWRFITQHCYTIDNENGEVKLFPSNWTFLQELLADILSGLNLARKKSRRLLITWFVMAFELWALTFKKNFPMFNLSKKEKLVDDGGENSTPNSLHGKIRFMWERLPKYLQCKINFANLRIDCPGTGSFIIGESSNEDAGRGGGYAFGFIDEAAFIDNGETIFAAFIRACKQVLMVSTSNGSHTMFCRVSKMAEGTKGWSYKFLHALLRPDRSQDNLDKWKAEMTPAQFAREIEGKDIGNVSALVWPMFEFDTHVKPDIFAPGMPIEMSFDFGAGDPTAVKIWQVHDSIAHIIDEVESNNATPEQIVDMITEKVVKRGLLKSYEDHGGTVEEYKEYKKAFYKRVPCYGDPNGNNKQQNNSESCIKGYADLGIMICTKAVSDVAFGIVEVIRRLNRHKILVDSACTMSIDELSGCHYRVNERTGEIIDGQKYAHDHLSHGADAIRYFCENNTLPAEQAAPVAVMPTYKKPTAAFAFQSRLTRGAV